MTASATIYFHQGFTDIINCLPLIDYYVDTKKYDNIYIVLREDAESILQSYFFNKDISMIKLVLLPKVILDQIDIVKYMEGFLGTNLVHNMDFLIHGNFDILRHDKYKFAFHKKMQTDFFVKALYSAYDIDYSTRINKFSINRFCEYEDQVYNDFIKEHGSNYILTHEIDIKHPSLKVVNLNQKSETFFEYIKVIQNAKEIHLLDSVWAAIIYLLDAKYHLFADKNINVYCNRGYIKMFTEPIKLQNWKVHDKEL